MRAFLLAACKGGDSYRQNCYSELSKITTLGLKGDNMSDRRSGNGSLALGGGSIAVMVLTLLLQNSGALGDFSEVLSGPGGVALLAVGCVIASVSFTYLSLIHI